MAYLVTGGRTWTPHLFPNTTFHNALVVEVDREAWKPYGGPYSVLSMAEESFDCIIVDDKPLPGMSFPVRVSQSSHQGHAWLRKPTRMNESTPSEVDDQ
jgi:hypothetical protein